MNKQEFLQIIRKQIHFIFDRDSVEQEISQHIEDSIADLMSDGYKRLEAEKIAVEQMGDPIEIGKQLNEEHHPLLGYLLVASRAVLALLIIPAIIMIGYFAYDMYQLATPTTRDYGKQIVRLDIDFNINTHDVTLDYLYDIGSNKYSITYRARRIHSYSRTGWSSNLFTFEENNRIYEGGYESNGMLGSIGCKDFEYPEDGILILKTTTDEIITIDLKEYIDEKK